MVGADRRILVTAPDIVHTGFELNDVIDVRSAFRRPVHMADDATDRKSTVPAPARHLFERFKHPILIEYPVSQVRLGVRAELELPLSLGRFQIDSRRSHSTPMVNALNRIDDMNSF